jgi:predicted amidophosphoribosyltransferase
MEILILFWIVCGIAAAFVASSRGANGCLWAFLGFLLGPIGLLMAFASQSDRKCPHCQSGIHADATRCPKCQVPLSGNDTAASLPAVDDSRTVALIAALKSGQPISSVPQEVSGTTKKCPYCAETILTDARKCKHCGEFLDRAIGDTFCTDCGQPLAPGLKFCGGCGKAVIDMPRRLPGG